ncbi:hypothetical protein B0H10DRAFT_1957768 [Mycena sp. CBHHK59/15]|nr:hypothetical protein B0H10DRAFT_1957768 [Mycena sp. CBHHK59/15]
MSFYFSHLFFSVNDGIQSLTRTMVENPLWDYFWRGAKQNSSMYMSYCKGCVAVELEKTGATTNTLTQDTAAFKAACQAVGNTHREKHAWIAHILGGKTPCPYALAEAMAEATLQKTGSGSSQKQQWTESNSTPADVSEPPLKKKQTQSTLAGLTFCRNDMPFGAEEKAVFQKQALRVIVLLGAPLQLFKDPEMKILFGMLRTTAPGVIPTAKVVGGRLLNAEAAEVEEKIKKVMKGKVSGLSTDGWKGNNRESINGLCTNVDFKAYLLELINITAENKDGPSQCDHFAEMIDHVELKYRCFVIYFTTVADGGSKKGRILLGKKRPWLILPSCWAHQFQLILGDYFKVNNATAVIAEDATGLIAWLNNHSKRTIQVSSGAVKIIILAYLVANLTHWTTHFVAFMRLFLLQEALEFAVLQNRPAIIAAQVGAATSTEAARLKEDAERFCALIRDQAFWEGLETVLGDLEPICLGTNINQKDSTRLDQVLLTIAGIYLRFAEHPEEEVRVSMLKHLEKRWKDCDQSVFLLALILNPFEKLSCFDPNANLNQIKCRNMLLMASDFADINDWEEMAIRADLRAGHVRQGLFKSREGRKNHKCTATLLSVPRYRDLLEDQDDEDPTERGCGLVSSMEGWRTQMATWIADAKAAEAAEWAEAAEQVAWNAERLARGELNPESDSDDDSDTPRIPKKPTWKPITLALLFGGAEKPHACKPSAQVMEEEEILMQALADEEEDARPDDGAIEIDLDEEYQ